jgi:hypothetical protein
MNRLSSNELQEISAKIKKEIFIPAYGFKTTILVCGASLTEKMKLRYQIVQYLTRQFHYPYRYDIIHPEDIFDELLYNPKLRKKLICVLESKYKKNKSFINEGPVRLIKQEDKRNVIYVDGGNDLHKEFGKLSAPLTRLKSISDKEKAKLNLLQLENYLLPAIYLLEPIGKKGLISLVYYALEDNKLYQQATVAALNIMTRKKLVSLTTEGYILTRSGLSNYHNFQKAKKRIRAYRNVMELDRLRLEIMNLQYRNKKIAI